MKANRNPYDHFPNYVLRTPVLGFDFYKKITFEEIVSDDTLKKAYTNPLVKEACFLASPTLYFEIEKWINGQLEEKKERKLRFSLLKYLTRMSTRCTPFGLFAGCALGNFDEVSTIANRGPEQNTRHTRLDMNYLVALSQDLSKKKEIQEQLLYYPNSSIYISGNQIRYIEYHYLKSKRQHNIVEVDNSTYLKSILEHATSGALLSDLVTLLIKDEISKNEAKSFIDELIESQLLVSELEPSVSGHEFMIQILQVLQKLKGTRNEIVFFKKIEKKLRHLDDQIGNPPKMYMTLSKHFKEYGTSFELKYLFQADMELRPMENKLSAEIPESIKQGMLLLNKINRPIAENNLVKFKEAFFERYEEREMPLSKVLDVETGIGYIQDRGSGDINPLVDDIILPVKEDPYTTRKIDQDKVLQILEKKLISSEKAGLQKITLTDDDFKDLPLNWEDLPDTMSAMASVIYDEENQKIKLSGLGGASAANLLGRFCHGDVTLNKFTQSITDLEKQMNTGKVLAEIVHLPEARVGNILMRPSFREYEIPYLAKSDLSSNYQIPVEDLLMSVWNDRIFLRSKRLNKEVLPRLTNAHNFSSNSLPIYHFLCDMQTQELRGGLYFNFGLLENNRDFLPRVEYRNLIISEAKWQVKTEDIQELLVNVENIVALRGELAKWRKEIKLPQYALLSDGDNELLINFENMTSVQMLLDAVKNRSAFVLSEFLFASDGIVKSAKGYFTHQILLSFFNKKKLESKKKSENG
jgi:class I lanthipeptide synthase